MGEIPRLLRLNEDLAGKWSRSDPYHQPASGAYGKPGRIRSNIRGRCDNGELRQQRPVGRHLSQPQSRRCPYRLARAALKRAVHEAFGRGAGNRAGGGRRSPLDIGLGTRLSAGLPTRLEDHRRPARQRHRLGNDRHGQRSGYLRHQGANGRQPGDSPGRPHSRETWQSRSIRCKPENSGSLGSLRCWSETRFSRTVRE